MARGVALCTAPGARRMRPLTPILIACLLGSAPGVSAQVYRWVDDRGGVHYGNVPPPAGAIRMDLRGSLAESFVRAPSSAHPVRPRELPASARMAPSAFPGAVDERTVASLGHALHVRACEKRPAHCMGAAAAAPAPASLAQLSGLHVP